MIATEPILPLNSAVKLLRHCSSSSLWPTLRGQLYEKFLDFGFRFVAFVQELCFFQEGPA